MGERFGNYEILRKLASGGMAEVLLAKQRGLGGFERLVCLKRILPHLSAQEEFLKMFQDEARIAANLVHPNVAQIYDIAQENDNYYIAMEYVRGEDLRRVYNQEVGRGQAMPRHIAAQVMMGAAAGLDYAHRQTSLEGQPLGIVHRDVSPQNIVVTYDGFVKLIDFGVAKAAGKLNETRSGVLKGKYSYMSPEQASGDPVDGRTDIFAMGVTLYEITTGTRLFKRENELETLHAVIACNVTKPSEVVPGYDADLESIVLKALAYDADDRFATAGEMERELETYLVNRKQPTSAANLAMYMHDLFAEKLADEALFGGPPWSEPATADNHNVGAAEEMSLPAKAPTTDDHTIVDSQVPGRNNDDWNTDDEPLEKTASNLHINATQHAIRRDTLTPTPAALPSSAPSPEAGPTAPPPTPVAQQLSATEHIAKSRPKVPVRWRGRAVLVVSAIAALLWWRQRHLASEQPPIATQPDASPGTNAYTEPPIDPEDPHAYLSVQAPVPMEVTLGNRYLGDTPIRHLPMEPGSYRLRLENKGDGLIVKRNVRLEAGSPAMVQLLDERGSLAITGKPWAWVRIGLRPAMETPARLDLLQGEYSLVFECPGGQRHTEQVRVTAGNTTSAGVNCER